jgi:aldehyde dehydrogenase (NAD+)
MSFANSVKATEMTTKLTGAFQAHLDQTHARLRAGLTSNPRDYNWRISQLRALRSLIEENENAICEAIWKDLRKSKFECLSSEQGLVLAEIELALKKLRSWMKPRRVSTPIYNQPGRSYILHEPLGLTLIIGAWNYPVNLLLTPLVGAIAGGNGAILKPSEIAAHTARLLSQLVPKYLDQDLFAILEGDAKETGQILDKRFDLIFFTGSSQVGKVVLSKAAPHLTPTILELGGKCPAIVWKDADLKVTARRIAWGKFVNAGQTCVAPDYLIVHPQVREALIQEIGTVIRDFYGADASQSPDYCRLINEKNFDRVAALLDGLNVVHGGTTDRAQLYIEPTIVEADETSAIMRDEIFGPILPVLEMPTTEKTGLAETVRFINEREKPLALYVFTKDPAIIDTISQSTSSGAICINDDVIHLPVATLPFGGVGASGMGRYHGRFSFDSFTHAKGILRKSFWFDVPIRYPPYTETKATWMKRLFK